MAVRQYVQMMTNYCNLHGRNTTQSCYKLKEYRKITSVNVVTASKCFYLTILLQQKLLWRWQSVVRVCVCGHLTIVTRVCLCGIGHGLCAQLSRRRSGRQNEKLTNLSVRIRKLWKEENWQCCQRWNLPPTPSYQVSESEFEWVWVRVSVKVKIMVKDKNKVKDLVILVGIRVRGWVMSVCQSPHKDRSTNVCLHLFFQYFISFCEFDLHSNISVIWERRVHERVCARAHLGHFINILWSWLPAGGSLHGL